MPVRPRQRQAIHKPHDTHDGTRGKKSCYYANPGSSPDQRHPLRNWRGHLSRTEDAEETAVPVWYDSEAGSMLTIPTMKEGMTVFLVTGDASRNKVQTMPGGGYATVKIELPSNWDTLLQPLGYNPLRNYHLQ